MKRVTGIGGIFFTAKGEVSRLKKWYATHLGIEEEQPGHGVMFNWRQYQDPEKTGLTVFSVFEKKTDYLSPSDSGFMINFRVKDLAQLLETLKAEGVEQIGGMQEYEYGKFAWIMDPEGNKIELWEPPAGPAFEGGVPSE